MIPFFESLPKALYASVLFSFDLFGCLVNALLEEAGWGRGAFGGALELDLFDYGPAVVVGGDDG